MQQIMARMPDQGQGLIQGTENLYTPPPGAQENLAGAMRLAGQLAPNGIPWREWRRSDNVEDARNPQQGGIEMLKQWYQQMAFLRLLQQMGQK